MHPLSNRKWKGIFVLSNGLTVEHVFGTEEALENYIKGVFSGKHLLRKHESDAKYSVYPTSTITEVKVERFVDEEKRHFTGPSWNV